MRVAVIGGGGREHAIVRALRKNKQIDELYCLPGNGGIAADAVCVPIAAVDIEGIVNFCREKKIDFAAVIPDDPLVMGCVDRLHACGIKCFGPESRAAIIEGSKVFSKSLMKKYGIPTASYEVFDSPAAALSYIREKDRYPAVIKADGLALGKGVIIAADFTEAESAVRTIMEDKVFGASGNKVVIEEFLEGPEVSVLCFTDGCTIAPMVSSMDHKRALDGDKGLNTGGMGTVAPNPYYTPEIARRCMKEIFVPTVEAMNAEQRTFKGCLYFGLMLTKDGPKVIEYNCRFGDPETQVVLPLLRSDLFDIMRAVEDERLSEIPVEFSDESCCCVIAASGGYPVKYAKGYPITIGDLPGGVCVYHAGTKLASGELCTNGGRVLGVCAVAPDLRAAVDKAYSAIDSVSFKDMYYRRDIGARALKALD